MDLNKFFLTDCDLEETGVWVDVGDAKVKVARLGNKKSKDLFAQANKQQKIISKYLTDTPDDVLIPILAKSVLLDWEGLTIDGKTIAYTYENAVKVLTQYKDFRNLILELSMEAETFRRQVIEGQKEELGKS